MNYYSDMSHDDPRKVHTRRPHRKTKTGCATCKKRKIKVWTFVLNITPHFPFSLGCFLLHFAMIYKQNLSLMSMLYSMLTETRSVMSKGPSVKTVSSTL